MKALAEISASSSSELRAGRFRRGDLSAFESVLERVGGVSTLLLAGRGQNTSAVAAGIAAAAAAGGARTALVECDLAQPALAGLLGLAAMPGLHEYLRWEAKVSEILQPLVLAGPASDGVKEPLVCIVAGKPSPNGEVLLASQSFTHANRRLRAAYDLVILAGPPITPAVGPLHRAAAHADAVVACVDASEARGRPGRHLRRDLRRLPARFAGFVSYVS